MLTRKHSYRMPTTRLPAVGGLLAANRCEYYEGVDILNFVVSLYKMMLMALTLHRFILTIGGNL